MGKTAIVFIDGNNWYHNSKASIKPSLIDFKKLSNFVCKQLYISMKPLEKRVSKFYRRRIKKEHRQNELHKACRYHNWLEEVGCFPKEAYLLTNARYRR